MNKYHEQAKKIFLQGLATVRDVNWLATKLEKADAFDLVLFDYVEERGCTAECEECNTADYCPFTVVTKRAREMSDPRTELFEETSKKILDCFSCPFKKRDERGITYCEIDSHSLFDCYEAQQEYQSSVTRANGNGT